MVAQSKLWCDEDDHHRYEHFVDFNEWLNGEEGQGLREQYGLDALTQPSKAFYTVDRAAYHQAFQQYQIDTPFSLRSTRAVRTEKSNECC